MSDGATDVDGTDGDATAGPPEYVALVGAIVAITGTLLPWRVTADGATVGLEANGFLAIIVAFGVLTVVAVLQGTRTTGRVAIGGGALISLIAGHWIAALSGLSAAGIGVYATAAGGIAVLSGGIAALRHND